MARRCNRCRGEFSSLTYYRGDEYCMTCYVRLREEEAKKRAGELARQTKADEERRRAREQYLVRPKEREEPAARPVRGIAPKSRRGWEVPRQAGGAKPEAAPPVRRGGWAVSDAKRGRVLPGARKEKPPAKPTGSITQPAGKEEEISLSLAVASGLPVSLSAGQKNVVAVLAGKNASGKRATVEVVVSVSDSEKKPVEARAEPAQCVLEAQSGQQFAVKFDLKGDVAAGPLVLSAFLRENAVYVDRQAARSQMVSLTAQVKTPMELVYLPGSARFEEGGGGTALCANFENRGETGGRLSAGSRAGYGIVGKLSFAPLAEKTKIKGLQKKVLLRFSPAQKTPFDYLSFELLGNDANGKEFVMRKSFRLKGE